MEIMNNHIISNILLMLLATTIMQITARILPESNPLDVVPFAPVEHPEHSPSASVQFSNLHELMDDNDHIDYHRHKREAYDPYDAYYYYPTIDNPRPRRGAYDPYDVYYYYPKTYNPRPSYINRRDTEDNRITEKKPKYKYTPLLQYKSTQSRRRKLFVPNLFG